MKINRFEIEGIKGKHINCSECRKDIETEVVYTINLATNKNNGIGLVLCDNCAKELLFGLKRVFLYNEVGK